MIKRITIPDPITLEDYCDKNDLTIILTKYRNEKGVQLCKAEIQGCICHEVRLSEKISLTKLAEFLSTKTIVISGRIHKFPILRCY